MARKLISYSKITGIIISVLTIILLSSCSKKNEAGSSSGDKPASENISKVRSLSITISGDMNQNFEITEDDNPLLMGRCSPDMWANFGIKFHKPGYAWLNIALMTKKAIKTGQTGEIPLDWVDFSYYDEKDNSVTFKGKGKFQITEHNAKKGNQKLSGTIEAENLPGKNDSEGKSINLKADFVLNTSCGVESYPD